MDKPKSSNGCVVWVIFLVIASLLLYTISKKASSTILTMEQYDKISVGHPYQTVRDIIGWEGQETSQVGSMITIIWRDGGGSIACVFTDGFVSGKTHQGLRP